jgi:serine/threonine-protein kinase
MSRIALDDPAARAEALRSGALSAETRAVLEDCDVELDDRYVLERELGEGSTSTVHAGYDLLLERDVAIKIVHREHDAVLREAASTATVSHGNVVHILDVRVGEPSYIVMELLSEGGADARSASAEAPRDLREALRWVRDAARGVAAAHVAGVWHGDLKPANLLVLPVSRQARLIDFGMASSAGRAQVGGTPELMAPEMLAAMVRQEADAAIDLTRVDAYGLGALAYALITGRRPRPTAARELAARLVEAGRARPTFTDDLATRWDRPLGRRLAALLAPALAEDPAARPDAAGLADELDRYLARGAMSFERRRYALRAALWCRRYPSAVAAMLGAVVLAAIAVAAVVTWGQLRDVQRDEAAASLRLAAIRGELAHARDERDAAQKDLAANRARDAVLMKQIADVTQKDATDSSTAAQLRATLATAGDTVTRLEGEVTALGERVDTDAAALVSRDGEITDLHTAQAAADAARAAERTAAAAAATAAAATEAAKQKELTDALAKRVADAAAAKVAADEAIAARDTTIALLTAKLAAAEKAAAEKAKAKVDEKTGSGSGSGSGSG